MIDAKFEEHGNWFIWHDPLPIEWKGADWRYVHKDATEDLDTGTAESREMCLQTIDWLESQETEEAQEIREKESKAYVDRMFNTPLIEQLGAGLIAANSILAVNGRGFADGFHRETLKTSLEAYNVWAKEREGDKS